MTGDMLSLSLITVGAVLLFALEVFPVDKVSVLILASLVALRLVSAQEAVAGFGHPATITIACMLAMSYGIESTGILDTAAARIVSRTRGSEFQLLLSMILATGLLSAFINNTAAVALLIPLTLAAARERRLDASKFLMPLSFGAIMAGTCTLVGTSTNLLVASLAQDHMGWAIGVFEFTLLGAILFAIGTIYLITIGPRLMPSRRTRDSITEEFRVPYFLTEIIIEENSNLIGKSIVESDFAQRYNVDVVEILRGDQILLPSEETSRLEAGDILLVQADPHTLVTLRNLEGIRVEALSKEHSDLEDENTVLVEAFISPTSRLVDSTLKEVDFRRTFKANAVALRSHGRTIRQKVGWVRLEYGDSLLILVKKDHLETLRNSGEFLVLEEVTRTFARKDRLYYAVAIFVGAILLVATGLLSILETAILGVGMMILTGCLRLQDLYHHLSWQILIMLACLIPMGTAMETTGLADYLAQGLIAELSGLGPWVVLSGLYLMTTLLTSVMSNGATAVLMFPIALSTAQQLQVNPKPLVIAVIFAASSCFMTPVGYQTNLFVSAAAGYRFSDFLRVGGPLNLIFWIVASYLIPRLWPF